MRSLLALLLAAPAAAQCLDHEELLLEPGEGDKWQAFGASLAVSGERILVGAWGQDVGGVHDVGSVYTLVHAGGVWSLEQKIAAPTPAVLGRFGLEVALDGDRALISDESSGEVLVHVYERLAGTWTPVALLAPPDPSSAEGFGFGLALRGDLAAVGATRGESSGVETGEVLLYRHDAGVWSPAGTIAPQDGEAGDQFGAPLDLHGDRLAVAASQDESGAGAVYLFRVDEAGVSHEQTLRPTSTAAIAFGTSLDLDGERLLVGAPEENGPTGKGTAYFFDREASGWAQTSKWGAPDGASFDKFGTAVALRGARAVVGNRWDDDDGSQAGSAHVFERYDRAWRHRAKVVASAPLAGAEVGTRVAISEAGWAVASAPQPDGGGPDDVGRLLVFDPVSAGCPALTVDPPELYTSFGGQLYLNVLVEPELAGLPYLVVGSLAGTTPGLEVLGVHLPLNLDALLVQSVVHANEPPYVNNYGLTFPDGSGTACFTLEPGQGAGLVGQTLHHALVVLQPPLSKPVFVSAPVATPIFP